EVALTAIERAIELYREAGDRVQVGSAQRLVSRLHWFQSRRAEATAAMLEAIAILEEEGDDRELAWGYSYRSQLAMLNGDTDHAIADARRALALIGPDGDAELRGHALNNIGTARITRGDLDGITELRASLDIGLANDHDEHIVRAFCNLVALAVQQHRQPAAD